QNHSAAVNVLTTPKVQYGYASGSDNTIRATTITYPDGRVITYDYDSTDSMPDALSRVAAIVDDDGSSTHLADYSYLGQSTFVETDYTEPDIKYTLIGTAGGNDPDTGNIYRGLDRFGRIVDSYWYDYGSSSDVDRIKYGYGRSGNRLWRENVVARSLSKEFDELYTYDAVHRLKDMSRGTLDSGHSSLSSTTFAQCWGLDETGNWSNFREDDDGNGSWNLNQDRAANKVNEISDITESTGPSWTTPAYSKAGNMTTVPKPADPTTSFTATYDAWNRLTKLVDTSSSDTVAEFEYDTENRRSVSRTYNSGVLADTRHLFYTYPSKWQIIEERIDANTTPTSQFIWGMRYVDDLILRDRDADDTQTPSERNYATQDANWNTSSAIRDDGTVSKRFVFTPYGKVSYLSGTFAASVNDIDWTILFGSYSRLRGTELFLARERSYVAQLSWSSRDPAFTATPVTPSPATQSNLYQYVDSKPTATADPFGLAPPGQCPCYAGVLTNPNCASLRVVPRASYTIPSIILGNIYCDTNGTPQVVIWNPPPSPNPVDQVMRHCIAVHEQVHIDQLLALCPDFCKCTKNQSPHAPVAYRAIGGISVPSGDSPECDAIWAGIMCLDDAIFRNPTLTTAERIALNTQAQGQYNNYVSYGCPPLVTR
ncbi:MAG: hypothetical protein HQ518_28665, partial [Rhodopirellula sp.]|nr:hypothetical protein [Rhodopirellula sp.]